MILKNLSKRLITINAPLVLGQRVKAFQVKCGKNNECEVPDELCRNKFVRGLVEAGDLSTTGDLRDVVVPIIEPGDLGDDGLDDLGKTELTEYAEAMGIDVLSKWTKADIIEAVRAA